MSNLCWLAPNCRGCQWSGRRLFRILLFRKDSSDRIDHERPNVAAVQTVVYRRPAVAIVCRSENAAKICSCKNVATRIGRQRAKIGWDHVVTNFYPTFSTITRAVDAASSADKVSSYENVTILEIDLLPMLPAVSRAKHAAPVSTGENKISRIDVLESEFAEWVLALR